MINAQQAKELWDHLEVMTLENRIPRESVVTTKAGSSMAMRIMEEFKITMVF